MPAQQETPTQTSDSNNLPYYDVIVIGAGIQGAGVAQAAALQGWSVLVIEQFDGPAQGTSSKSSKLIHGGLRYLETAQFSLVKECLQEKAILQKIAPKLVKPATFVVPVYKKNKRSPFWVGLGLWLYSLLGGSAPRKIASVLWKNFPHLNTQNLRAMYSYEDAQTDDAALTRVVLAAAQEDDAEILYSTEVNAINKTGEGYKVNTNRGSFTCATVVNAAGPWVNTIAGRCTFGVPMIDVDLVQGAHIVLDTPAFEQCFYFESPDDSRAVFTLPWKGKTMVGTTETHFTGDPKTCAPTADEEAYLKRAFDFYFPALANVKILESFAGLRVLPMAEGSATKRARDTRIVFDNNVDTMKGYYAIYGGKLTGYRATAEKVVQCMAPVLGHSATLVSTKNIHLN